MDKAVVWYGGSDGRVFCREVGSWEDFLMSRDKSFVRLDGPPWEGARGYEGVDPVILDCQLSPAEENEWFPKIFPAVLEADKKAREQQSQKK